MKTDSRALVEKALKDNEECRDSHIKLWFEVLKLQGIVFTEEEVIRKAVDKGLSPETVSRDARYFQNTLGLYPPSAAKQRERLFAYEHHKAKYSK